MHLIDHIKRSYRNISSCLHRTTFLMKIKLLLITISMFPKWTALLYFNFSFKTIIVEYSTITQQLKIFEMSINIQCPDSEHTLYLHYICSNGFFSWSIMYRWVDLQPSRKPARYDQAGDKTLGRSFQTQPHPFQTFLHSVLLLLRQEKRVRLNLVFAEQRRRDWGSAVGVDAARQLSEVVSRKCWQSNAARGPFKRQLLLFPTPLSSGRVENAGEFHCAQQ